MILLYVLLGSFLLSLLFLRVRYLDWYYYRAASISMGIMLLFAALGHFMYLEGMMMMFPEWVPFKREIVLLSGLYEILLAINLWIPKRRKRAALILIIYLILILPGNIYAALENVNYVKADYSGQGPTYLWFRIPLQLFWIAWAYFIYQWKPKPLKNVSPAE